MADDEQEKSKKLTQPDLEALRGLSFGTDWSAANSGSSTRKSGSDRAPRSDRSGSPRPAKDRRPSRDRRSAPAGESSSGEDRPRFGGQRDHSHRPAREPREYFQPLVEVQFQPNETVFETLANAMRQSMRTYELFEIARLILGKPERHEIQLRPLTPETKAEKPEDKSPSTLYLSVPDQLPFLREDSAVEHVLKNHLEKFFTTEEVELEAPKGNFQFVTRCTLTNEVIGPPNYHLYTQLLQQHHAARASHLPFDTFRNRLETVREEEVIQAWVDQMKKGTKYTLVEELRISESEDSPVPAFTSLDDARSYLLKEHAERVVKAVKSVRIDGVAVESIADEGIRKSIAWSLERQDRFPMDTANIMRSRLRRQRFYIYKKGSKGISYVCAVRRRFRQPDQVFAESVQKLLQFLESNPYLPAADLAEKYLGLPKPVDEAGKKELAAKPEFKTMLTDLRWLLNEGYLMEYSDGRLFLPPVSDQPNPPKPAKDQPAEDREEKPEAREEDNSSAPPSTGEPSPANPSSDPEPVASPAPEPAPSESPTPVEDAPAESAEPVQPVADQAVEPSPVVEPSPAVEPTVTEEPAPETTPEEEKKQATD